MSLFKQRHAWMPLPLSPALRDDPGSLPKPPQRTLPLLQSLTQLCHPTVTQGVGSKIQAPEVFASCDHVGHILAAGGSEVTLHQPADTARDYPHLLRRMLQWDNIQKH